MVPIIAGVLMATGHAAGFCMAAGLIPSWACRTAVLLIAPTTAVVMTKTIQSTEKALLVVLLPVALALTADSGRQEKARQLGALAVVAAWFGIAAASMHDHVPQFITVIATLIVWALDVYRHRHLVYKGQRYHQ